ncbi:MAG: type IV pilus modification PilV family protein [Myxococcota bacterium]
MKSRRAFTLLEVVVALAILGVSLVAVLDINSNAVYSHVYAKKLTIATLLARSKMTDLEQKLYDEPLPADDDEDAGDFSEEGWPGYKWRAKVIVPKTNGLTPEQLFGALFNIPLTGDGADGLGGMLGGLFGAGAGGKSGAPTTAGQAGAPGGGAGLLGMLGPAAGMAQQQFTQMVDQLQKSVREVHLTVTWKEGKITESIDLVTHVVSMGPGSDRNGGAAAAAGQASTSGWVRPDGTPARSPRPGPNGQGMVDDDNTPLMPAAQNQLANPAINSLPFGGMRPLPVGAGTGLIPGPK